MSVVFTETFLTALRANLDLMTNANIVAWFFRGGPGFSNGDPRYTGIDTIAELQVMPGWSAPVSVPSAAMSVGTRDITSSNPATGTTTTARYVMANNPFDIPSTFPDSQVNAVAFVYQGSLGGVTNPIIFISNTPFPAPELFTDVDSIVARPDAGITTGDNRWLFSWQMPAVGQPVLPVEGPIAVLKGPPPFESSHTQHVWLYPQRVNTVANPSFEGGTTHWRGGGTVARIDGNAPGGGLHAGQFGAATGRCVAESNFFPIDMGKSLTGRWTIQAMVRGTGNVRIGLVYWNKTFDEVGCDWGTEEEVWTLPADGWLHLYALRQTIEADRGQVRIEAEGSDLVIDNVLAEPDWLLGWPYFDGDTTYGARDDFSWYGGENRKGKTYSMWYNHRRAVVGRLFAYAISAEDVTVTDEEIEAQGFVYGWVPAGTRVIPHLDVLYKEDIQEEVPDVAGTTITRYRTDPGDSGGIPDPWD